MRTLGCRENKYFGFHLFYCFLFMQQYLRTRVRAPLRRNAYGNTLSLVGSTIPPLTSCERFFDTLKYALVAPNSPLLAAIRSFTRFCHAEGHEVVINVDTIQKYSRAYLTREYAVISLVSKYLPSLVEIGTALRTLEDDHEDHKLYPKEIAKVLGQRQMTARRETSALPLLPRDRIRLIKVASEELEELERTQFLCWMSLYQWGLRAKTVASILSSDVIEHSLSLRSLKNTDLPRRIRLSEDAAQHFNNLKELVLELLRHSHKAKYLFAYPSYYSTKCVTAKYDVIHGSGYHLSGLLAKVTKLARYMVVDKDELVECFTRHSLRRGMASAKYYELYADQPIVQDISQFVEWAGTVPGYKLESRVMHQYVDVGILGLCGKEGIPNVEDLSITDIAPYRVGEVLDQERTPPYLHTPPPHWLKELEDKPRSGSSVLTLLTPLYQALPSFCQFVLDLSLDHLGYAPTILHREIVDVAALTYDEAWRIMAQVYQHDRYRETGVCCAPKTKSRWAKEELVSVYSGRFDTREDFEQFHYTELRDAGVSLDDALQRPRQKPGRHWFRRTFDRQVDANVRDLVLRFVPLQLNLSQDFVEMMYLAFERGLTWDHLRTLFMDSTQLRRRFLKPGPADVELHEAILDSIVPDAQEGRHVVPDVEQVAPLRRPHTPDSTGTITDGASSDSGFVYSDSCSDDSSSVDDSFSVDDQASIMSIATRLTATTVTATATLTATAATAASTITNTHTTYTHVNTYTKSDDSLSTSPVRRDVTIVFSEASTDPDDLSYHTDDLDYGSDTVSDM
jgi:hypothetical protein